MICLGDVYPMSGDWEIPTTKIEGRRRLSWSPAQVGWRVRTGL